MNINTVTPFVTSATIVVTAVTTNNHFLELKYLISSSYSVIFQSVSKMFLRHNTDVPEIKGLNQKCENRLLKNVFIVMKRDLTKRLRSLCAQLCFVFYHYPEKQ